MAAAERSAAAAHQAEFVSWLNLHDVDMTRIDLIPASSGLSWGAHAACALPAGTPCATIPLSIALTEDVILAQVAFAIHRSSYCMPSSVLTGCL